MTNHLVWLIATAVITVAVLTIGTLAAAGILERDPEKPSTRRDART